METGFGCHVCGDVNCDNMVSRFLVSGDDDVVVYALIGNVVVCTVTEYSILVCSLLWPFTHSHDAKY